MTKEINPGGLSIEEKAAMKEHLQDQKKAAKRAGKPNKETDEQDVLEKINALQEPDRSTAHRLHSLIKENHPELAPRTWYGMPAYARDGKVICFYQSAQKFKTRYSTFGFNDAAQLDDGVFWPVSFALKALTPEVEEKILALLKQAVS